MPRIDRKNELLYRVYFVLLAFFLLSLVITYRIVKIAVFEGEEWRAKKDKNYMVWRPMKTERGQILSDDGQSILATSVEFFEIRMDPVAPSDKDFYNQIDGLCAGLAKHVGKKSAADWKKQIVGARVAYLKKKKGGSRSLLIDSHVDHFKMKALQELPLFKLGQYKGGLIKTRDYSRERPFRSLAARTVGIDRDNNRIGLENYFNRVLQGEQKNAYMKRVSSDLYIPVFDPTDYEIIRGKDIVTTINVPMQDVVHNELLRGLEEFNGKAATAIIMEVATGRIKAISNLSRNTAGEIGEFENFGIAYSSEPGSTIKAASVLALFEDGLADPSTIVDFSEGKKKFYGHWMHDSGNHGISKSTLQEALEISSNVGIASVMDDKYNKSKEWTKFASKLEQFGLYDKANVEIEGEPAPIIKNPVKDKKDWYNTTIPWMAHGYEMQMTPLQVLKFYNAVANNGKLMQPQLVSSIVEGRKTIKRFDPIVQKESIAKADNIAKLQELLAGVVTNGTGKGMKSSLYNFSGKTGTTKVGYSGGEIEYNASFAGYWPSESPKYSMIVVVYGLKGSTYYGNVVAGPIFKRIMDWCYTLDQSEWVASSRDQAYNGRYRGSLYGYSNDFERIFENGRIPYKNVGRWVKGRSGDHGEILNGKALISTSTVPDVSGMGPRDAIYVLENLGMRVKLDGYGRVAKQSIRAGNKIENREITLYLN